ncbi:aminotransferase class I/II-fold pyridoxal phosphate-dependent enzyme [Rickettsiales bacterium LUAb2]
MFNINNELLDSIQDYPFDQLEKLLPKIHVGEPFYKMYIGEPITSPPEFIGEIIAKHQKDFAKYPSIEGLLPLRESIYNYLDRRYGLKGVKLDINSQILATAGSKEALYCIGSVLAPFTSANKDKHLALIPNPFYQVYKATSVLNGGKPYYLNATPENDFQPDISSLPENILKQTKFAFICNPSNPQGAIMDLSKIVKAVETARKYNFILVFDECYTDLYNDKLPTGAIDAIKQLDGSFDNVIISHTLSKRSSAAGLRSGFIVGDTNLIKQIRKMRSFSSPVLPEPIMHASIALWDDAKHVTERCEYYRANYKVADRVFKDYEGYRKIDGALYLWLPVKNSKQATIKIWENLKTKVLPGEFLADTNHEGINPGENYIRVTLNYDASIYEKILPGIKECLKTI